jgi:uncharacterized membrane protein
MIKAHNKIPADLSLVLVWTVMTVIFAVTPALQNSIIRTVLGLPLVLFIPGYVLITALFPKKDDLDSIEIIALSFGLSIATVPLLGLLLNFTPFGIRLIPILIILCSYSIILTFVTDYRRKQLPEDSRFEVPFYGIYEAINNEINAPKSKVDRILSIILVFSIILSIGILYYVITTPKIGEKFTEFYILGDSGKAENYPTELKLGSPTTLLTGVVNHEYSSVNYTVQIVLNSDTLSSNRLLLNNNETWQNNISFVPNKAGNDKKLELLLFKENNFTSPYRELHLWVNTTI